MEGKMLTFMVVVFAFAYAFYQRYTSTRIKLQASGNNPNQEALKLEIEALKQRIATLEAIVTDKSYTLKQQIDQL